MTLLYVASAFTSIGTKMGAKSSTPLQAKSPSVPFLEKPPALDGSMAGDVGFDPLGFSNAWLDVSRTENQLSLISSVYLF
jgi:hypothetical protein